MHVQCYLSVGMFVSKCLIVSVSEDIFLLIKIII